MTLHAKKMRILRILQNKDLNVIAEIPNKYACSCWVTTPAITGINLFTQGSSWEWESLSWKWIMQCSKVWSVFASILKSSHLQCSRLLLGWLCCAVQFLVIPDKDNHHRQRSAVISLVLAQKWWCYVALRDRLKDGCCHPRYPAIKLWQRQKSGMTVSQWDCCCHLNSYRTV